MHNVTFGAMVMLSCCCVHGGGELVTGQIHTKLESEELGPIVNLGHNGDSDFEDFNEPLKEDDAITSEALDDKKGEAGGVGKEEVAKEDQTQDEEPTGEQSEETDEAPRWLRTDEFLLVIRKCGQKAGLAIQCKNDRCRVHAVRPGGVVAEFNELHPEFEIKVGDWIEEVNGVTSYEKIKAAFIDEQVLHVTVVRRANTPEHPSEAPSAT